MTVTTELLSYDDKHFDIEQLLVNLYSTVDTVLVDYSQNNMKSFKSFVIWFYRAFYKTPMTIIFNNHYYFE